MLDRHINAQNRNQVLLFLIFIKNQLPHLTAPASLIVTQVCKQFAISRKTLLYLQKAVETCCVPGDGISGFVWSSTLTVSVKSNRFSCQKKQLDNTRWHNEHESLHFTKLPLHRALKTVFTSFRKYSVLKKSGLEKPLLGVLFWWFLKIVSVFNCSPSFNLQLTSNASSSGFQHRLYLPSNCRLREVFRRQHLLFTEMHASQVTYPYTCRESWLVNAVGAGQLSSWGKAVHRPELSSSEEVSQAGNSVKTLNRPKQSPPLP